MSLAEEQTTAPITPANIKIAPRRSHDETVAAAKKLGTRYEKGDVWMVTESRDQPAVGTEIWSNRPAVIMSADMINNTAGFVQVVYLSTVTNKLSVPSHIEVPNVSGKGSAIALCEQVHTVDVSRLKSKMGRFSDHYVRELDEGVAMCLSLGRKPNGYGIFAKWERHMKTHGINMRQEIEALSARTSDERVEALTRALETLTAERDAYRTLYETTQTRPDAMREVVEAINAHQSLTQSTEAA